VGRSRGVGTRISEQVLDVPCVSPGRNGRGFCLFRGLPKPDRDRRAWRVRSTRCQRPRRAGRPGGVPGLRRLWGYGYYLYYYVVV